MHDLIKHPEEKMEIFILQHPQEAGRLPHCGAVEQAVCPDGLETLHQVVLVLKYGAHNPAVEVPAFG